MYRRIYCLFDNVHVAKQTVDQLLLARVGIQNIHLIAKENVDLGDLPEASMLQKSDIRRALVRGLLAGAILGILAGLSLHSALSIPIGGLMFIAVIGGALLGIWFATMVGMMMPNVELKPFQDDVDKKGLILAMIDTHYDRIDEIKTLLVNTEHVDFKGVSPTYPQFP